MTSLLQEHYKYVLNGNASSCDDAWLWWIWDEVRRDEWNELVLSWWVVVQEKRMWGRVLSKLELEDPAMKLLLTVLSTRWSIRGRDNRRPACIQAVGPRGSNSPLASTYNICFLITSSILTVINWWFVISQSGATGLEGGHWEAIICVRIEPWKCHV